ncbi:AhpC/TSA family protein [Saccharicrinis carchari]|uniref:AhpC/TSA family protein n=1 Tax=Saccharicrinis carchari TaxID=1168039 RepID=A0A521AUW4_SACCC|nr:thioredoxin family protein [Saccharicrinis carchari]SMO38585.1 AhpC/TSA family protein [Saccharicrinis carchari]
MKKKISILLFLSLVTFTSPSQVKIGDTAPGFKLKNIDNSYVALDHYHSEKGVILIFTCNHCPYSKLYEDRIVALDTKYKRKGFPVVALNPNNPKTSKEDAFDKMIIRAEDKGFTFPYLVDNVGIYKAYGATKTPHVYLLENEESHFTVSYIGAIDDSPKDAGKVKQAYLAEAIDAILAGNKPRLKETKAIGCSIKPY